MTKKNPDKQLDAEFERSTGYLLNKPKPSLSGDHDGRLINILMDSVILGDVEGLANKSIDAYEDIQDMLHDNEKAMTELQDRTKRLRSVSAVMMKGMTRHQKITLGIRRLQREGKHGAGCGHS